MKKAMLKIGAVGAALSAAATAQAGSLHRDLQKEEANRKIAIEFFNATDVDSAMKYVSENYKQHNPTVADGKQGVREFFTNMRKRYPNLKARVVHTAADGDLVWVHAHMTTSPEDPGVAFVDIFRVEHGKFVEHWDVMQPVPESTASGNPMF